MSAPGTPAAPGTPTIYSTPSNLASSARFSDSPAPRTVAGTPTSADFRQARGDIQHTSSKNGTFCFAYGSNLSAHQMSVRCTHTKSSAEPVAVARLDAHAWIICERGYANVVPAPSSYEDPDENTVWGIVYNLSSGDEAVLDRYEGHNFVRNADPEDNPDPQTKEQIPHLQNGWDYNKHYLPVTVTKWLQDPADFGVEVNSDSFSHSGDGNTIKVLVYVDEKRTQSGVIEEAYIGRMNRGIREATALGLPERWVERVMRHWVPKGIEVPFEDYVGTEEGYIEANMTANGGTATD